MRSSQKVAVGRCIVCDGEHRWVGLRLVVGLLDGRVVVGSGIVCVGDRIDISFSDHV